MATKVTLHTGINYKEQREAVLQKNYLTLNQQLQDAGKLTDFNKDVRYKTIVSNSLLSHNVSYVPEDTKKYNTINIKLDSTNPKEKAALNTIEKMMNITKGRILEIKCPEELSLSKESLDDLLK